MSVSARALLYSRSNQAFTVLINRDYRFGTTVKFDTRIPAELKNHITPNIFFETMTDINEIFAEAEVGSWTAYLEGVIASLTGNIQYFTCGTQFDRKFNELKEYISFINKKVYNDHGLTIEDPTSRALRALGIRTL